MVGSDILVDGVYVGAATFAFLVDANEPIVLRVGANEADSGGVGGKFFDAGEQDVGDGGITDVDCAEVAVFEGPDAGAGGIGKL